MKEQLLELLHREPYIPFRIVMTSGREFEIVNPDLVAVGESQITLYPPRSNSFQMLRLNQIASLEATQAA